jgi:5-methylcytosine-specific restriction protein A
MSRNPVWVVDELILALELYLREGRKVLSSSNPEVIKLSGILNQLPIHPKELRERKFRNPNGIEMKLGNFRSLDP